MTGSTQAVVIGIDQGTTNTKALALAGDGTVLATASRPLATRAPHHGWLEQDAGAMLAGVRECTAELLANPAIAGRELAAIGIANQTETLVVWDEDTGEALMPAIIWQCRRGDAELAALREAGAAAMVRRRTGLDLDPTFTAAKLRWLFRHRPDIATRLREGSALFGTVDTWLTWKLGGGAVYATDAGNASRTALFDINELAWADGLFDLYELSIARRPQVRRSTGPFGSTLGDVLGASVPICGVLGDQQASLFGHGCVQAGQLKITYGTGAFLWLNAGSGPDFEVGEGLLRTVAWLLDEPCYAVEGFVMQAGAVLDWLAERLSLAGGGAAVAAAAEATGESGGVMLVPAFQGLAAPWWSPHVRGALFGLSEASATGHICHAALESLCFQVRALLEALARSTGEVTVMRADGGPTRSHYLMRLQADIARVPLAVAPVESTSAYGAALMAGLGSGLWKDLDAISSLVRHGEPVMPAQAPGREQGYRQWRAAVDAVLALHRQLGEPEPV